MKKIMPLPTKIYTKFHPMTCLESTFTVLLLVNIESMSLDYLYSEIPIILGSSHFTLKNMEKVIVKSLSSTLMIWVTSN